MKRVLTAIRCVPRLGLSGTQLRILELDVPEEATEQELLAVLRQWFAQRGLADAVYDVQVDRDGLLAVINDDAFEQAWGAQPQ